MQAQLSLASIHTILTTRRTACVLYTTLLGNRIPILSTCLDSRFTRQRFPFPRCACESQGFWDISCKSVCGFGNIKTKPTGGCSCAARDHIRGATSPARAPRAGMLQDFYRFDLDAGRATRTPSSKRSVGASGVRKISSTYCRAGTRVVGRTIREDSVRATKGRNVDFRSALS